MISLGFDKNFKSPVIGIDEVGRGSWAGPVVASASFLIDINNLHPKLNDSKKLSPKLRFEILKSLERKNFFGLGNSSNIEIDQKGILNATFIAMERAINDLIKKSEGIRFNTILIDGSIMPEFKTNFGCNVILVEKGDQKSPSIASASIYAKCNRDKLMKKMNGFYKGYGLIKIWVMEQNIIKKHLYLNGPTQIHRMSFSPMKHLALKN